LEEGALSIVQLVWAVNALCAEVPRCALFADSFAGLADLLKVVREVTSWARSCTRSQLCNVVVTETCSDVICASSALVVFGTKACEALFVALVACTIDLKLSFLAFGDAQGLSSEVPFRADFTLIGTRASTCHARVVAEEAHVSGCVTIFSVDAIEFTSETEPFQEVSCAT
jgi:hypothetical protein